MLSSNIVKKKYRIKKMLPKMSKSNYFSMLSLFFPYSFQTLDHSQ